MPSLNTGNAILSNAIAVNSSYNVGIGGAASGSFKLQVTGSDILVNGLTIGEGAGSIGSNTVVGASALPVNTTGTLNTAIGNSALLTNTTGYGNTSVGYSAIGYNTTGFFNAGVGVNALLSNTTGTYNNALGTAALYANTTGSYNTAVGQQAGTANTTGSNNTYIGYSSGLNITTGSNNTIIGNFAGTSALANNIVLADGAGNVRYQWDGTNNVFTGNATFSNRVSVRGGTNQGGYYMDYQSDASSRSFRVSSEHLVFGDFVIQRSTTRTGTTYEDLLYFNASRAATFASSISGTSIRSSAVGTFGFNTANNGEFQIYATATDGMIMAGRGSSNDMVITNKNGNDVFRIPSGTTTTNLVGDLGVGTATPSGKIHAVGINATSANNALYLENAVATILLRVRNDGAIYTGTAANSPVNLTTGSAANVFVESGSGLLYRSTSSLKYKKNVENYTKGLAEVMQMRPVYYKGKGENDGDKQYAGLIAEEIHDLGLTEFVQYAEDGTPDALAYSNMIALAFKAIQELNQKINEQQQTINSLINR